jgi:hypothetical protein
MRPKMIPQFIPCNSADMIGVVGSFPLYLDEKFIEIKLLCLSLTPSTS